MLFACAGGGRSEASRESPDTTIDDEKLCGHAPEPRKNPRSSRSRSADVH